MTRATGYEFASRWDLERVEATHRRILDSALAKHTNLIRHARRRLLDVKLEQMRRRNGGVRWDHYMGPMH